jgi:hypothetical protein
VTDSRLNTDRAKPAFPAIFSIAITSCVILKIKIGFSICCLKEEAIEHAVEHRAERQRAAE